MNSHELTTNFQQLRPVNLQGEAIDSKASRFREIDAYCRDFDAKMSQWSMVAKKCKEVRDDELWRYAEKPYPNFDGWLADAMPTSVSTARKALRLYESLQNDFTFDEMKEMPTETAKVVAQLPKSVRKDPRVRAATKKKRKEFIEVVQEAAPEQHLEAEVVRTFTFTLSQWEVIEEALEAERLLEDNPELPAGEILAGMAVEWLDEFGPGTGLHSRRERAAEIKGYKDRGEAVPEIATVVNPEVNYEIG